MPAGEEGSQEHMQTAPGVTLAICAFNEAANISRQIELILAEDPNAGFVTEVLVVSSGSTDGTNELVRDFSRRVPRLRLIEEAERRGKVAAVNIVIREAKCDRIVLMGADCILSRGALRRLAAATPPLRLPPRLALVPTREVDARPARDRRRLQGLGPAAAAAAAAGLPRRHRGLEPAPRHPRRPERPQPRRLGAFGVHEGTHRNPRGGTLVTNASLPPSSPLGRPPPCRR